MDNFRSIIYAVKQFMVKGGMMAALGILFVLFGVFCLACIVLGVVIGCLYGFFECLWIMGWLPKSLWDFKRGNRP